MRRVIGALMLGLGAVAGQAQDLPAKPDAQQEPTITVKGRHQPVKRTLNSTTYDVKDNSQGQAGSAADVLNTVPSVNVSPDGGLTVRGSGNVRLYINGKPSSAAGSSYTLLAMSGGTIASVEVMTNPSSNYDANGGAIVNLILKKNADAGAHATLTANAGDHGRANATASGSYGGKNVSANANVSLRDDVRFTDILSDRTLTSPDGAVIGRSVRRSHYTPTHGKALNANGSLVYKLTASSDLGADFDLTHSSPKNRVFEYRADYDPTGNAISVYDRVREGTYFGHSADASIYYQDRGSEQRGSLKIVAQAERDSVRSDRPFILTPLIPVGPTNAQRIYIGTFTQQQRLSIDYERPARKGIRFSIGSELKRDALHVDNAEVAISPDATDRRDAPPVSTVYRTVKTTAALYVTVEAKWGKWTALAGERGQLAWLDFDRTSAMQPSNRRVTGLNHNLSIARDVGSDQLRLTRSQQLFDLRDLDPLVTYVDPDTRGIGNPGLLPQEITSLESAYNFGKGNRSGAVTFYYRYAQDTLADYSIFLADNVEVSAKRNFGNAQSYGMETTLSDRLTKTLKFSATANLFHTEFPHIEDNGSGETRSKKSYTARLSVDWKPGTRDDLHLDANAQGPTLVPQGEKSGTYVANMVWRHTLSAQLTLSLTGQSVLRRTYVRTVLDTPTGHDVGQRLNGGRAVLAGLKYKID